MRRDLETRLGRVLFDDLRLRQIAAGEDLVHDELEEPQVSHGDGQFARGEVLVAGRDDRVQHHDAACGHRRVGHLEELVVPVPAEVFERADGDDAVDAFVKLLPALQQHSLGARAVHRGEARFDVGLLVAAQCQADGVDVVAFDGSAQSGAPAAADVEKRHTGLQIELAEGEVDLGHLGLFQRHVLALEIRAAVGLTRIQEEAVEVVGQVVVRLHVLEVRPSDPRCPSVILARYGLSAPDVCRR